MDSRYRLLQMIEEAHSAMRSKCMNCPWCLGKICSGDETHDDWCKWPGIEKEIKEMREGAGRENG